MTDDFIALMHFWTSITAARKHVGENKPWEDISTGVSVLDYSA